MTRRSVDLPLPLGPSSAVSEPPGNVERDVVERDEVAEALGDVADRDSHAVLLSEEVHEQQRRDGEQGQHDRGRVGAVWSNAW